MNDLISRRDAIDILRQMPLVDGVHDVMLINKAVAMVELMLLPHAEPKTGKWKNIVEGIEYACGTCDTCGMRMPMVYKYYEYCPHCGMKNEVEHDE